MQRGLPFFRPKKRRMESPSFPRDCCKFMHCIIWLAFWMDYLGGVDDTWYSIFVLCWSQFESFFILVFFLSRYIQYYLFLIPIVLLDDAYSCSYKEINKGAGKSFGAIHNNSQRDEW
jgi:hypothetical protein